MPLARGLLYNFGMHSDNASQDLPDPSPPRKSLAYQVTFGVSALVTLVAAALAKGRVSDYFAEGISAWANNPKYNGAANFVIEVATNDINLEPESMRVLRVFDPKQWRSNIVFWGAVVGGFVAQHKLLKAMFPDEMAPSKAPLVVTPVLPPAQHSPQKPWVETVRDEPAQAGSITR